MATYGYARVSSKEQNLDEQLKALREYGIEDRYIIIDKESGKTFDRKGYNSLVGTEQTAPRLQEGDLLVILFLDRLGRDYTEIQRQWEHITKELKANIKVLEIPLLDTTNSDKDLDTRFISDLVLQILSYVAEKERLANQRRRELGIAAMPVNEDGKRVSTKSGNPTGRPEATYPDEWESVISQLDRNEITAVKAMEMLSLKKTTFYRLLKAYRQSPDLKSAQKSRKQTLAKQRVDMQKYKKKS